MTAEDQASDDSTFLARPLPDGFTRSVVTVEVGGSLSCSSPVWHDALVLVVSGEIEVEAADGTCFRFGAGAVLTFADLPRSRLCNSGTEVAHLVTVRRSGQRPVEPPTVA